MPVPRPHADRGCPDCGTPLSLADGTCPDCGGDATRHNRWRLFYGSLGTVLTLSIVFAPIGLPMLLAANHHRRMSNGGDDAPSHLQHAGAVIRSHLGLPATNRGDFTRGGPRHVSIGDLPPEL